MGVTDSSSRFTGTRVPNFGHIYRRAIETPEGGRLDLIFFEILPTVCFVALSLLLAVIV